LEVVAEALAGVDRTEERWYEAELHRLKGELLRHHDIPDAPQAEACFHQAPDHCPPPAGQGSYASP
jgi:hypothetical protein